MSCFFSRWRAYEVTNSLEEVLSSIKGQQPDMNEWNTTTRSNIHFLVHYILEEKNNSQFFFFWVKWKLLLKTEWGGDHCIIPQKREKKRHHLWTNCSQSHVRLHQKDKFLYFSNNSGFQEKLHMSNSLTVKPFTLLFILLKRVKTKFIHEEI